MELEQSGSTVPLHSPERLLLLPLPSVPPETMTTMPPFPQWESSRAVVEPRMLYWARVKKLFKYCQLSDADDQSCLVTPAWPCSSVSHYGLLHAAGRWQSKPLKKKNLFSLKDCSRVDRTKSHRNDTFMYLHLDTLTHACCYCYDYCPNWNVLGVDVFKIFLTDDFDVQLFYQDITPI